MVAAQPQDWPADDVADDPRDGAGGQDLEPERKTPARRENCRRVGAKAVEGTVTDREQPGIADQQIEAEGQNHVDAAHDQKVECDFHRYFPSSRLLDRWASMT